MIGTLRSHDDAYDVSAVTTRLIDEPDPACDAICRIACAALGTSLAFVTRQGPEGDRLFGYAQEGAAPGRSPATMLELAGLGDGNQPLAILDLLNDTTFTDQAMALGADPIRFYARLPVVAGPNRSRATLHVADGEPRTVFGGREHSRFADLAMLVEALLHGHAAEAEAFRLSRLLRESHDRQRTEEQVADFGRFSIDLASGSVFWSAGLARLFGREEWAEQTVDLETHIGSYHPNEQRFVRRAISQGGAGVVNGTDSFTRRHCVILPDGTERDVVLHGQTVRDAEGRPAAIRGITLDISDLTFFERGLQVSEALIRNTLENMDEGLVHFDTEGRVRVYNQRARAFLDLPEEVLHEGASFEALLEFIDARGDLDGLRAEERAELDRLRNAGEPHSFEITFGKRVIELRYTPLPEGDAICTYTDISARRAAEHAVRDSDQRFRLIAENMSDVILLGDSLMRGLYVSPSIRNVLGYEPEELIGRRPDDLIHPEDAANIARTNAKLLSGEASSVVSCTRYRHKEGHYVWIEVSVRLVSEIKDNKAPRFVASLRDVTARVEADEQVRYMALHDSLTGLPNRILFRDRLERALVQTAHSGLPFAVFSCDLDHFKAVNDSLGHPAGDTLLRVIGQRMTQALQPYDTVARLGGDEFAIILGDLGAFRSAETIADELIAAVGMPIDLDGHRVQVGISVGVTISAADGADADEVFKRADMALYDAKGAGRRIHRVYDPAMGARAASLGQLGIEMREAIRNGEFRMVYQPIVSADTGSVTCFEALMRWAHPRRGEIPPGSFISLAEESGLIVPLGTWAVHVACQEATKWPNDVLIAVNVSPVQLRHDEFVEAVEDALSASGLPASRLKLEVTENVLIARTGEVLERLHRLKKLGIRIALDDFGTGYSSLSYLRRFPFDVLKIDRSFIKDIAEPDAAALVKAIAEIGTRLDMRIVAEGVENEAQLGLVREAGCHEVQGFLFSKPLASDATKMFIDTRNPA